MEVAEPKDRAGGFCPGQKKICRAGQAAETDFQRQEQGQWVRPDRKGEEPGGNGGEGRGTREVGKQERSSSLVARDDELLE